MNSRLNIYFKPKLLGVRLLTIFKSLALIFLPTLNSKICKVIVFNDVLFFSYLLINIHFLNLLQTYK